MNSSELEAGQKVEWYEPIRHRRNLHRDKRKRIYRGIVVKAGPNPRVKTFDGYRFVPANAIDLRVIDEEVPDTFEETLVALYKTMKW